MPPYRFRLETLLRVRAAERDERRAELAKALRAEAILRDQCSALESEQTQVVDAVRALSAPGSANVDRLLGSNRYQLVLRARGQQLQQQTAQVAAEVERRRQALVEADRQVRVLEKLRERQQAAHRAAESRGEVKMLDEAAILGYARRGEARP